MSTPHKKRREFGNPISYPKDNVRFIAPPVPGTDVLELDLKTILPRETAAIAKAGKMVFHMVGDTGGVHGTGIQEALAVEMEAQITHAARKDKAAFFYHLGDVVYYNGLSKDYSWQFYEPYQYYPAEIFAIPGNHDCDTLVRKGDPPDTEPTLFGFVENFCDMERRYSPHSSYRKTMIQPYVYWTLQTPLATIIGLFSNVDGCLDKDGKKGVQYKWLVEQLKKADADKCLLVTVHHPIFSLDTTHGGYGLIYKSVKDAFKEAQRYPDAIFHGHVHNYQRFSLKQENKEIPVVIAGAGGYANTPSLMHHLQTDGKSIPISVPFQTTLKDVRLEAYNQKEPGFLRITIDENYLTGEYFVSDFNQSLFSANPYDQFRINWKQGKKEMI